VTLQWEGGYSNHPDDPGGPTMRGIIQREYDAWRAKHGLPPRPVRKIEDNELQDIYRHEYWDALGCDDLPLGVDLCVFDAGVNSGVGRTRQWMAAPLTIDSVCDRRLAFLEGLGRLWHVFGPGWARRVAGIRAHAKAMAAGEPVCNITWLQQSLNKLGASLAVDGLNGAATQQAVKAFQVAHGLTADGIAGPVTLAAITKALAAKSNESNTPDT